MKLIRATKHRPCPICGKAKYCVLTDTEWVLCGFTSQGAVKKVSTGWWHYLGAIKPIDAKPPRGQAVKPPVKFDPKTYLQADPDSQQVNRLAAVLKLPTEALVRIGCRYVRSDTFAFPMYDASRQIIGIKFRTLVGRKWCAPGSRLGVYLPTAIATYGLPQDGTVYIAEGESDCAALLAAGFWPVIGRPSVNSGADILCQLLADRPVVLFVDRDFNQIGLTEALKLAKRLKRAKIVYNPAYKDVRDWFNNGILTKNLDDYQVVYDESEDGSALSSQRSLAAPVA